MIAVLSFKTTLFLRELLDKRHSESISAPISILPISTVDIFHHMLMKGSPAKRQHDMIKPRAHPNAR